ncbi:13396_t:CDS:2 [Ambispora gerdemannii]|uniref:13396_t:CDS:1 n=1 Tax=Ambispora gerdemannii TaxID=144530 RepID=A0A9N9FCN2_9GLOM|nr:13396_t:CDS:2 [Ambispora gerdemannii]
MGKQRPQNNKSLPQKGGKKDTKDILGLLSQIKKTIRHSDVQYQNILTIGKGK